MIGPADSKRETDLSKPPSLVLELPREREAPASARAAVTETCSELGLEGALCHTLVLLVSELVSNAVVHSSAPPDSQILLTLKVVGEAIRVSVTDAGSGFSPKPRVPGTINEGYGLYLVDKAASGWGVDREGGTRVWFEIPLEQARSSG